MMMLKVLLIVIGCVVCLGVRGQELVSSSHQLHQTNCVELGGAVDVSSPDLCWCLQRSNVTCAGQLCLQNGSGDSAFNITSCPKGNCRCVKKEDYSSMRNVVFMKLHKVASTTVSMVLERIAAKAHKKMCARGDQLLKSVPCEFWTTHDNEEVFVYEGVKGFDAFVGENPLTITILRDPIERVLSRYFYNLVMDRRQSVSLEYIQKRIDILPLWLQSNPGETVHYTKLFSRSRGVKNLSVEKAIANLEDFTVVGVTEEINAFMVLVATALHVPVTDVVYKNEKVVVNRPKFEDLPIETQQLLERLTLSDRIVYEHAKKLMHQNINEQPPIFRTHLRVFESLEKQIDQRCQFERTQSTVLSGWDCYQLL
eukprot:m.67755 g.67755  ORF g.67755 m.67755 type:complete len:368 (-) comp11592_c2_seq1:185-1288(-)